uniref:BTB domain-containing protein n=1 Tax=Acrobeloides nanus TaxID=290746 RepID=A0A914E4K7_9BILA
MYGSSGLFRPVTVPNQNVGHNQGAETDEGSGVLRPVTVPNQNVGHNQGAETDDWQRKNSLQERMLHAYSNELFADVVFLAGEEEVQVKAHKYVLCISSPVFIQMFHGPLAQSTQKETIKIDDKNLEIIRVPDITPEALNVLLIYIYSEMVALEVDIVFNVLYAAKKYLLDDLEKECAKFLDDKIDAENVCYILTQALVYQNEQLVKTCESIISFATADVIKSEEFKNLDEQTLCRILQFDSLHIDEWTLFKEVLNWAEAQCVKKNLDVTPENKRLVLSTALYAIRFPVMSPSEFAAYANDKKNCLLSENESHDLLLAFILGDVKLNDIPFNHDPRGFVSCTDVAIYNTGPQLGIQIYGKHSIGFIIKSSARFWLTGFGIYGANSSVQNVDLTINVEEDEKVICEEVKRIKELYIQNIYEHRVNFTRPIAIYTGARYVLNVDLGTYRSPYGNFYYGNNGMMTKQFLNPKTNDQDGNIVFGPIPLANNNQKARRLEGRC